MRSKASNRALLAEVGLAPRGLSREEALARFGLGPNSAMRQDVLDELNDNYLTEREVRSICGITRKTLRMLVETKRIQPPYPYLTGEVWKRENIVAAMNWFAPANPIAKDDNALTRECVYFVSGGTLVKIGWAQNARTRLVDLQHGSPEVLKIIGMIPGGSMPLEQRLHAHFSQFRKHGEWFDLPSWWKDHVALGGHALFFGKRKQFSLKPRRK